MLNNQGLEIKGVWETKDIFLFVSFLTTDVLDRNNIVYDKTEFCWGDASESSELTALAILLWFLVKDEAHKLKESFLRDIMVKLPQGDFETSFNYEYWRNGKINRWIHPAQPMEIVNRSQMSDPVPSLFFYLDTIRMPVEGMFSSDLFIR